MKTSPRCHFSKRKVKFFVNRFSNKHRLPTIDNNSQKPVESYCSIRLAESHYRELKFFPCKCFPFSSNCCGCHKYITISQICDPGQYVFKHHIYNLKKLNYCTFTLNWSWNIHLQIKHRTILTLSLFQLTIERHCNGSRPNQGHIKRQHSVKERNNV